MRHVDSITVRFIPSASAIVLSCAHLAVAGLQAQALAVEGLPTPGSGGAPITVLNDPFTTTDGRVGFTGAIDNGLGANLHFVWFDGQIVWLNSDALPILLTGAESTMGIGDGGEWIYSPSEDGEDAVWSNGASLLRATDPAPGFEGQFISFCSRPQMNANGTPTWISGITFPKGGGTIFRALYSGDSPVIAAGDEVDGLTIANAGGLGFAYDFSRDGASVIVRAVVDAPTASNDVFVVGDSIAAREGDPTGQGDNWQNFGDCKINNAGAYVFSGDTSGPTASDGFLALNSQIIIREGDAIDGLGTLTGNPTAVAINDLGQIGAIWGSSGGEALILLTPDGAGGFTLHIPMKVGDGVDLDGNGLADGQITDFNASSVVGPGLDLPRQCRVCANVDVNVFTGPATVANVCVALPAGPGLYDLDGDGTVDGDDLGILLAQFGGPGSGDFDCNGVVDGADLGLLLSAW
jgi:hypothetical protein